MTILSDFGPEVHAEKYSGRYDGVHRTTCAMMVTVQWFLWPGSGNPTRFIKLAAASVILLLVVYYQLRSTDQNSRTSRDKSSAERRRHQHVSRVMTLYNYSLGLVWPNGDDVDNDDDRITSQIDVINVYAQQKRNRKLKIILRVGNFNFDNWRAGQEEFVRDRCPIVDCWLSSDQSQAREADALLISEFDDASRRLYLPKPHRQIWIAQHWESPLHNRIDPVSVRGLINWTISYRHDSTIAFRYVKMVPGAPDTAAVTSGGERSFNYAAGKTKLVAWFVSNCNAGNERMRYAQELSQFIQV